MFVGPFIDKMVTSDWVFRYHFTTGEALLACWLAGCALFPPAPCSHRAARDVSAWGGIGLEVVPPSPPLLTACPALPALP